MRSMSTGHAAQRQPWAPARAAKVPIFSDRSDGRTAGGHFTSQSHQRDREAEAAGKRRLGEQGESDADEPEEEPELRQEELDAVLDEMTTRDLKAFVAWRSEQPGERSVGLEQRVQRLFTCSGVCACHPPSE